MSNEPVESGSVFTVKDEMLMRRIGMQDAPLFSTQWNNEELLKNAIIFTYVDSMTIRVKENWKTDDLIWVVPSGLSLIFEETTCLEYQYSSNIFFNEELGAFFSDIHF